MQQGGWRSWTARTGAARREKSAELAGHIVRAAGHDLKKPLILANEKRALRLQAMTDDEVDRILGED